MVALLCFLLAVLAAPFKSRRRLEAENTILRHQLMILRRKVPGRVRLTNGDRWEKGVEKALTFTEELDSGMS
jgi:hypothetical protein